jgi:hypothetical protein
MENDPVSREEVMGCFEDFTTILSEYSLADNIGIVGNFFASLVALAIAQGNDKEEFLEDIIEDLKEDVDRGLADFPKELMRGDIDLEGRFF